MSASLPRKAMVLCAGLGTRLRPLTERLPKPAVPLLGRPLLGYMLAALQRAGVREVVVNTHHLPEQMSRCAREQGQALGLAIQLSHEPIIQGTAGGPRDTRPALEGERFWLVNGDIFFAPDFKGMLEAHVASGAIGTMALLPMPAGEGYGAVEIAPDGSVRRIAGRGPGGGALSPWHFTGVHLLEPEIFDFIPPSGEACMNKDAYPAALAAGRRVHGHLSSGLWSDIGTPRRYLAAHLDLLASPGALSEFGLPPLALSREGSYLEPGAIVEEGARIGPGVCLGVGARVGKGASLERCVVWPQTRIEAGELLRDCIAAPGVRVSATREK